MLTDRTRLSPAAAMLLGLVLVLSGTEGHAAQAGKTDNNIHKQFFSFEDSRAQMRDALAALNLAQGAGLASGLPVDANTLLEVMDHFDFAALMGPPHRMDHLQYVPAEVVFVSASDFRMNQLLPCIQNALNAAGSPELSLTLGMMLQAGSQMVGTDIPQLLNTLTGPYDLVLCLDQNRKISLPLPEGNTILFPYPQIALLMHVSNSSLFDLISRSLGETQQEFSLRAGSGCQILEFPAVDNPVLDVVPCVAMGQNKIAVSIDPDFLASLYDTPSTSDRLVEQVRFQNAFVDMPSEVNSLTYIAPEFLTAAEAAFLPIIKNRASDLGLPGYLVDFAAMVLTRKSGMAMVQTGQPDGVWLYANFPLDSPLFDPGSGSTFDFMGLLGGAANLTPTEFSQPEASTHDSASRMGSETTIDLSKSGKPVKKTPPEKRLVASEEVTWQQLDLIEEGLNRYAENQGDFPPSASVSQLVAEGPWGPSNRVVWDLLTGEKGTLKQIPLDPFQQFDPGPCFYFRPDPERDPELCEQGYEWFVWSMGPDEDSDIQSSQDLISPDRITELLYDPSRGENSSGDIINAVMRTP